MMEIRVGLGMDSHRFAVENKDLILGGVTIEGEIGLEANSDGDVVLHALFNSISQALGKSSISVYADPMCKKGIIDSAEYLKVILGIMHEKGYEIGNIGIMIEAKRPKILDHEEKIKEKIALICGISKDQIGITATTGEGLTVFGQGLGIQCFAIVNLVRK